MLEVKVISRLKELGFKFEDEGKYWRGEVNGEWLEIIFVGVKVLLRSNRGLERLKNMKEFVRKYGEFFGV